MRSERKAPKEPSHIVGIGGSAGGLEAFEQFFSHMPADTGMAFVIVQHLDPDHKGMLPELIQRMTAMRVVQIEDGMKTEPNCIYVIPPNADISILHGTLNLLEPVVPRGVRMPVDIFLRHLAEDRNDTAFAVILSGMGTDGTLGIRAIKEKMGIVMVQDPDSAKFDGMPRSAIATGLADYIGRADELPERIVAYTKRASIKGTPRALGDKAATSLQKIHAMLRTHTGQDFSLYKRETIQRRIKRRMDIQLIDSIDDYVRYLQENAQEVDLLFKELLIGVTGFFRDPDAWDVLKKHLSATVIKRRVSGTLRAWVVGCSTGEEAYSIAIALHECVEAADNHDAFDIQVFATDIDKDAVDIARRGLYDANIAVDVSPERLQRYFIKEEGKYRLKKEIRDLLVFAPHNVIMDPPFTKMDLVTCRNLLIYFSGDLQKKILPLLHYSVNPGGVLFLGPSETIAGFTDLFSTLDNKWKVFQRRETVDVQLAAAAFPASRAAMVARAGGRPEDTGFSLTDLAQRTLIDDYAPPAVLINEKGDILYINGRTGKFLEPSPGRANLNVYAMAREGLRYELGTAIRRATVQNAEHTLKGLRVGSNGGEITVDLTVKPMHTPDETARLLLVVFREVEKPPRRRTPKLESVTDKEAQAASTAEVMEMRDELKYTKERLQSTVEEMQASQEELQSTNEELQSANEELQSSNEELMTSKEEMQSLNEELATVNAELSAKVDLLSQANNDLRNLLNSTQIATIFLDNNLNIRRFTSQATEIIKMIDSDVGRPITDLVSNITNDTLADDSKQVLETLVFQEKPVQTADGRAYLMRIMPYRTLDNVIDGVVITFLDILELSLKDERILRQSIIELMGQPVVVLDSQLVVLAAGRPFYKALRLSPAKALGRPIYHLCDGQWDVPGIRELAEMAPTAGDASREFSVKYDLPGVGPTDLMLRAHRVPLTEEGAAFIVLAIDGMPPTEKAPDKQERR